MVELIAVLLMVGVLAVFAFPRLEAALTLRETEWRDKVLMALRQARHVAQGHRRLVCVTVSSANGVALGIATTNPATSCNASLPGPEAQGAWARHNGSMTATLSPAGTLYFQPDGRITSDGAGASTVNATVSVGGVSAIVLVGDTGHVQ